MLDANATPTRCCHVCQPGVLARCGLTFSGSVWRAVLLVPPVLACTNWLVHEYSRSSLSDALVAALPVTVEKVPFFVAVWMVCLTLLTGFFAIVGLAICAPAGYDNNAPRKMKAPGEMADRYPTLFRMQSAHNNSYEHLMLMMPCFWAAHSLDLEPLLFAKLSALILVARVAYIVAYVANEDLFRSFFFVVSVTAITRLGFGSLFPERLAL